MAKPHSEEVQVKYRKIPFAQSPLEIFSSLNKKYKTAYLLESIEGPKKLAQYSFIGFSPKVLIQIKDGEARIHSEETGKEEIRKTTNPLKFLNEYIRKKIESKEFRLNGGAVGYISYDAVRYWEKLPERTKDDMKFPDMQLGIYDDGIVFDHRKGQAFYYHSDQDRIKEVMKISREKNNLETLSYTQPQLNFSKADFEKTVEKAKEYVVSGDIFQVVLSKRYDFRFRGDLIAFYRALRKINPSPYMYFLKNDERAIVGSSPEMLVRVDNKIVETFPIAGTRPCKEDLKENRRLAKELLADPKERAEHVMLVDLARNDLGKISKFGSVRIPEFMKVHRYSHVQHIVSQVVGDLKEDCENYDALRAVFPAGTVSGAPKVRAMELIEELEPTRRGPYAGAVGYFSYNGNADFAITIRTLFAEKDRAFIQVGAGIVADSNPEKEWFETNQKAEALLKALKYSGENKK